MSTIAVFGVSTPDSFRREKEFFKWEFSGGKPSGGEKYHKKKFRLPGKGKEYFKGSA